MRAAHTAALNVRLWCMFILVIIYELCLRLRMMPRPRIARNNAASGLFAGESGIEEQSESSDDLAG